MTPEEKKMKQYTNSVERRLNMPGDVKRRVMNDFISSISARREAGQSDTEIYAELGSAKQAAADLNEQMREFAYRKSPWRFAFAALAGCAALWLLGRVWGRIAYGLLRIYWTLKPQAGSVGIIGGADGPTAIFLTTSVPDWLTMILGLIVLAIGLFGWWRFAHCRKEPASEE